MMQTYDAIIIGAGMYGLYAATRLSQSGKKILILEHDAAPFMRASYINQARVHNGYHYPRSLSTALKSAHYYRRFNEDFGFAVNYGFKKVYAVSSHFSYASADNFEKFCQAAHIACEEIPAARYFKKDSVEKAFLCDEYAFDCFKIRDYYLEKIAANPRAEFHFNTRIRDIDNTGKEYVFTLENGDKAASDFVLNATYASVNQLQSLFGFENFNIKYEICEMVLCKTSPNIADAGLTVMDGPFFSVMPFGLGGLHSLSAVHFTPHKTSYDRLPTFDCQSRNPLCTPQNLENCNLCKAKPQTAWERMRQLSRRYLNDDIELYFEKSIFAIKPILKASEIDDSRPTLVRTMSDKPRLVSVLSGKINTVYDLDEVL